VSVKRESERQRRVFSDQALTDTHNRISHSHFTPIAVPQLLYPEARKLSGFFIEKKPPSWAARNGYMYCGTALDEQP